MACCLAVPHLETPPSDEIRAHLEQKDAEACRDAARLLGWRQAWRAQRMQALSRPEQHRVSQQLASLPLRASPHVLVMQKVRLARPALEPLRRSQPLALIGAARRQSWS